MSAHDSNTTSILFPEVTFDHDHNYDDDDNKKKKHIPSRNDFIEKVLKLQSWLMNPSLPSLIFPNKSMPVRV